MKQPEQIKLELLVKSKDWKGIRLFFLLGTKGFNEDLESKLDPFLQKELEQLKGMYEPKIFML
jgi:hypothetical protein